MQDASAAQILAINQLVAADQTRTSIKCRSRRLRALTTTETDILDAGASVCSFSISVTISADEVFAKDRSISPVATTLPYDFRNSARNAIGSGFDGVIVQRHLISRKTLRQFRNCAMAL